MSPLDEAAASTTLASSSERKRELAQAGAWRAIRGLTGAHLAALEAKIAAKFGPFSLLLAEIALYTAASHTETWLNTPSGGNRACQARLLTRFRRNQPEN